MQIWMYTSSLSYTHAPTYLVSYRGRQGNRLAGERGGEGKMRVVRRRKRRKRERVEERWEWVKEKSSQERRQMVRML